MQAVQFQVCKPDADWGAQRALIYGPFRHVNKLLWHRNVGKATHIAERTWKGCSTCFFAVFRRPLLLDHVRSACRSTPGVDHQDRKMTTPRISNKSRGSLTRLPLFASKMCMGGRGSLAEVPAHPWSGSLPAATPVFSSASKTGPHVRERSCLARFRPDFLQNHTKATGVENRPSAECVREHQNRLVRKVAPMPNIKPKTFYKSFI
jgi:hypothetical protein